MISVKVTGKKSGDTTKSKTSVETSTIRYPSKSAPISKEECPAWAPVKGNRSSVGEWIYHVKGGHFDNKTNPEERFAMKAAARAADFR